MTDDIEQKTDLKLFGILLNRTSVEVAYGYFSFCLISGNMDILKNRINIFSVETSFASFQTWLPQV